VLSTWLAGNMAETHRLTLAKANLVANLLKIEGDASQQLDRDKITLFHTVIQAAANESSPKNIEV
jgi:hypothetical protein